MSATRIILILLSLAAAAHADEAKPPRLPEPTLAGPTVAIITYGDAACVSRLAGLLTETDPGLREQALLALGQTHNVAALPHIRKALTDGSRPVRCQAVASAAEVGGVAAEGVVRAALASEDRHVALAGIAAAVRLRCGQQDLIATLARDDPLIRAEALQALTRLGRAAPAGSLTTMLRSSDPGVRLRALANVALLTDAAALTSVVRQLAEAGPPVQRGAALALMGRLAPADSAALLATAATDRSAWVRRGTVRGWHAAGRADRVVAMLDDPAPMVRLAAIRAVGSGKVAGCTARLFKLMLAGPDDAHRAARDALGLIGADGHDVDTRAADTLARLAPQLLAPAKDPPSAAGDRRLERNVGACSALLGALGSRKGIETQLALLTRLQAHSPVLAEVAQALGRAGDRRALAPMTKRLAEAMTIGREARIAVLELKPVAAPFNEAVPTAMVTALAELGGASAARAIVIAAETRVGALRFDQVAARAAEEAPRLARAGAPREVGRFLEEALGDAKVDRTLQFHAARSAGKLKLKAALPALRRILDRDRPGRTVMHAAAWAIQEITGKTPPIPEPRTAQGDWILIRRAP